MKTHLKFTILLSCTFLMFYNCSSDDDNLSNEPETDVLELELNQLMEATAKYIDFNKAEEDGLIDVSGYVPNMGHHYLNPALSDGVFDLEKPEIILYVPDEDGNMQMVAVEYSIVPEDADNPGSPPNGFTGDEDQWHFNEAIGQWQLHVWTILDNPDGIFAAHNPVIGD